VMVRKVTTIRRTVTQPEGYEPPSAQAGTRGGTQKAAQGGPQKGGPKGGPAGTQEGAQGATPETAGEVKRPPVDWNLFAGLFTGRVPINIGKANLPNDGNSRHLRPLETVPKMELMLKPEDTKDGAKTGTRDPEEEQRNATFQRYKTKSELFKRHNQKQQRKKGGSNDSEDDYIMVKTVRTNKTTTTEHHSDDDDDD